MKADKEVVLRAFDSLDRFIEAVRFVLVTFFENRPETQDEE